VYTNWTHFLLLRTDYPRVVFPSSEQHTVLLCTSLPPTSRMASVAHLEERRFGVSNPMWPLKTGKPEMTKSGNSVQNGNSVQSGNSVQKEDSNRKKTKCSYRPVSYTHKDTGLRLALVSFRSQTASGPGSQCWNLDRVSRFAWYMPTVITVVSCYSYL
jgi:hypothetical protein